MKSGLFRALGLIAVGCGVLLSSNLAMAAKPADRSAMLFPYYEVSEVLGSAVNHHYREDTTTLLQGLQQLDDSTAKYCKGDLSLSALKKRYSEAYLAWLELSAVVIGPLLENNTVRQIDFRPLREKLLARAINKQPKGEQAMALVGSPAKGFPAFEYLMFQPGFKPGSAECEYAHEVVKDIQRTVGGLQWKELPENMQLYFNQVVGALHNLSWERMEKPLLKNKDSQTETGASEWPFSALDLSKKAWVAQWRGIQHLLVLNSAMVPQANRHVVPLEAYLRGLGQIELADTLMKHSDAANTALQANDVAKPATIEQSVKALKVLKGFMEQDVAKGLKVSIQFSSSDGD
ncbi:imelysin family protein [Limnobacter sp.]|uniref:imelysin family protein n=1 Tax=Limnobacter sp. TaxID=2003368 RepID=UPI002734D5ED|nr:imelysin family protein [Limnobacter sp.]MDP3188733.1 imelysin family protein [Limnobacter sp.]